MDHVVIKNLRDDTRIFFYRVLVKLKKNKFWSLKFLNCAKEFITVIIGK